MSTNWLLTICMEKSDSLLKSEKRWCPLDIWVELIAPKMNMATTGEEQISIPVTSDQNAMIIRGCSDQTEHKRVFVWKGQNSLFFVLTTENAPVFSIVCLPSRTFVRSSVADEKKLTELLFVKEVQVLALSVFFQRWVPVARRIRLVSLSRSTTPHVIDSCKLWANVYGVIYRRSEFCSTQTNYDTLREGR